jgi:transcriptional regulator with XRE-family HTH domain
MSGLPTELTESRQRAEIGNRLRTFRSHLKLDQKAMSARVGIGYSTYQRYEQGRYMPDLACMSSLMELGLNANWLLAGIGPMLMQGAPRVTSGAAALDAALITEAVQAVEDWLAAHGRTLASSLKGKVVALLIEEALERTSEGRATIDTGSMVRYMRLVG